MIIDCTGHGVPGAFVTMLVKAVERQIVNDIMLSDEQVSPAKVLNIFNKSIKNLLRQGDDDTISNVGFDGGILYINYQENLLRYAGAETALFIVQDEKISRLKGDRSSIGYKSSDINYQFHDHTILIKNDMRLYLTTDGYLDQNGGEKGFRFGRKRFMKLIEENHKKSFVDQRQLLLDEVQKYRGNETKNDDVTVLGFKLRTAEANLNLDSANKCS